MGKEEQVLRKGKGKIQILEIFPKSQFGEQSFKLKAQF